MALAYENNPNGICEDAPCCGCCGPQGDGRVDEGPPEYGDHDDGYDPYGCDPQCVNCDEETTYGSTMRNGVEMWYCENCEAAVCANDYVPPSPYTGY